MKTLKYIYLMLAISIIGCNKSPEYYSLESPKDQMKIKSSTNNLVLEKVNESEDIITFEWNEATKRDTDGDLVYYFRLYHAEMNNLQSELVKVYNNSMCIKWTTRELNNLLKAWQINPGELATIKAEVLAVVENSSQYLKPEVSSTQFNIIGYDPSNRLYITIEKGGQKRSIEMNAMGNDVYTWTGELDESNFWFVRNLQTGVPAYFKGGTETSLNYSGKGEGDKFLANKLSSYSIMINLIAKTIDIIITPINRLFFITSINGAESITIMKEVEPGTDIYYMKKTFEQGTEFRFSRYKDATWPAYVVSDNNDMLELKDETSTMFNVANTSTYVMTVDMNNLSIKFLNVYVPPTGVVAVVGDVVLDAGWNAGLAIQNCILVQHDKINKPEVISYTGKFKYNTSNSENAFKFVGDVDWGNGLFAEVTNADPFNIDQQAVTTDGSGDKKWQLTSDFYEGTYTLEMNLNTMKINLIKQ